MGDDDMTRWILPTEAPELEAITSRIGGRPLGPEDFDWPRCATCDGPMRFLVQLYLPELDPAWPASLILLFRCFNDPGMCEEDDFDEGGNAALVLPATDDLAPALPSFDHMEDDLVEGEDPIQLPDLLGASFSDTPHPEACGKAGGEPDWLVDDAWPTCDCGTRTQFVAQLEEVAGIRFDGGRGYVFLCPDCQDSAYFGWQSL